MKLLAGTHATFLVIAYSLFPGSGGESPRTHPAAAHPLIIEKQDIRPQIAHLRHSNHSLDLLFRRAYGIAAPFLLFRLKRLGFSNCRIIVTPEGLHVTAER